jgi:hypothetical protein
MRRKQARARAKVITGTFDPALWTIATALSAAVVYLARLI